MARNKYKGSKYTEGFTGIVHSVFESPAFATLSPHACKLLLELAGQYRGDNNGNLTAAWSVVSKRGWRSRTTLWRCKSELIEAGFVYVTRQGHFPSTCELLALTWFALNVSPKFDPEALANFKPKAYRVNTPLPVPAIKGKTDWTLPNGGRHWLQNEFLCPRLKNARCYKSTSETMPTKKGASMFRTWTCRPLLGGYQRFSRGHLYREAICWQLFCFLPAIESTGWKTVQTGART